MDRLELAPFLNPRHLQLIILPTEQCNFRCTYCYEDFEIGQMKENTVLAIKKLLAMRLPTLDSLNLSWFGGEPLMAKNIVTDINSYAQEACRAGGVNFRSAITTNAYGLDRGTFDLLTARDVRDYQISIDGDASEHDRTRKLVSGRGTFDRIWKNLLALRSSEEKFQITLRLHVHMENIDSMRSLLPKLQESFGDDRRFRIFLKAVGNWGGDSVRQMALIGRPEAVIEEFRAQLRQLGWFAMRPDTSTVTAVQPCYASKPNSFVIRADASLAKCTVAFSDPRNRIGRIQDDGRLEIDGDKVRVFMRGFKSMEESELHCPMKNMPKVVETKVVKFDRLAAGAAREIAHG
jgi:uncharacterized protein